MRTTLLLLCALTLGLAEHAMAQARPLTPIVLVGFMGDFAPAVTGGARWTYTPTPQPRRDPATGMFLPVSASWSFETLATVGVTFAEEDPVEVTAVGSAGVLRPLASGALSGIGLMALGSFNPTGIGPSVRLETSFRAVALQAGLLWFEESRGPRAAVTMDVTTGFICDLAGC